MWNKHFVVIFIIVLGFSSETEALSLLDPVTTVKNKIEETIGSGINEINKILNSTNEQMDNISEQLIISSEEFAQAIYNKITERFTRMTKELDDLTSPDSSNGSFIDLSQCKKISEPMDSITLMAYSNMSACIIDKIELGGGYSESIKKISNDALTNFTMIRKDIAQCTDNSEKNFNLKVVGCLSEIGVKATWMTVTIVPSIMNNITNLVSKMSALSVELPYCTISHGIEDLSNKYSEIYEKTKNCVDSKKKG